MKRKFEFSLSNLLFLLIVTCLASGCIFYSFILLTKYANSANDTIPAVIAGLGNVVGGIIGGIVAYLVASYQINKTAELDGKRKVSSSYSLLRLIKSELISNEKILSTFKDDFRDGKSLSFLESISTANWIRCSDRLGIEVSDETINKTHTCITKIGAFKKTNGNIETPHTESLIESISIAIKSIDSDIDKMRSH